MGSLPVEEDFDFDDLDLDALFPGPSLCVPPSETLPLSDDAFRGHHSPLTISPDYSLGSSGPTLPRKRSSSSQQRLPEPSRTKASAVSACCRTHICGRVRKPACVQMARQAPGAVLEDEQAQLLRGIAELRARYASLKQRMQGGATSAPAHVTPAGVVSARQHQLSLTYISEQQRLHRQRRGQASTPRSSAWMAGRRKPRWCAEAAGGTSY